jgi:hypothetical protein
MDISPTPIISAKQAMVRIAGYDVLMAGGKEVCG